MRLTCKRCNWTWTPRKEKVIICPKCKSPIGMCPVPHKLYIYPSVFDGNLFEAFKKIQGWKNTGKERYEWVKGAFEFGIFNDIIKKEYLEKLEAEYKEYAKQQIKNAQERLEEAKKLYESHT